MSVTVKFNPDGDGILVPLVVPYSYGDHILLAKHITCSSHARKYGENYIRLLESDRSTKSGQLDLGG